MKKLKLLLLSTTLLLPGAVSFANNGNESRVDTSAFINRSGTKKAISYNDKFSFILFDGLTQTTAPAWANVKNSDAGGEVIKDEASGVEFKVCASSTSAFKFTDENTTLPYTYTIKTGDKSSENKFIGVTIPTGLKAKIKAELYAGSDRLFFIDKQIRNVYTETETITNSDGTTSTQEVTKESPYGSLNLNSKVAYDFESAELESGTYYLNYSGSIFIGKLLVELQGLKVVNFMQEDGSLIESKTVSEGNSVVAPKVDDRIGEKFSHWSLTPNGSEFDFTTPITSDTGLYAVYEECNTYTVTFNMNYSGSSSMTVTVNENDTVSIPEKPKRVGYQFESWNYKGKVFNFKTLITEDITLTAKWVKDDVPTITGPDSLRFGYSKPVDIEAILLKYAAIDTEDGSLKIELEDDTYSLKAQEIGSYEIKISATDTSGNQTTKTIPVEVYDDVAPVFEAPETIYKSTSIALTTNDILKEVKAKDEIDGAVDIELKTDSYTGNANKVGDYKIEFLAKDKNKNQRTFALNVNVSDKIANVWYVPEKTINVQSNIHLTSEDIINLLINSKELKSGYSSIDVSSNYSFDKENPNKPGAYSVALKARYFSGEEVTLTRAINVYESEEATQKRDNWFIKACKGTYNVVIRNVGNFFIKIYNEFVKLIGHKEWQGKYLKGHTIYE